MKITLTSNYDVGDRVFVIPHIGFDATDEMRRQGYYATVIKVRFELLQNGFIYDVEPDEVYQLPGYSTQFHQMFLHDLPVAARQQPAPGQPVDGEAGQ